MIALITFTTKILSLDEKWVVAGFLVIAQATEINPGNFYHIAITDLASLTGLDRFQMRRILEQLSVSVKNKELKERLAKFGGMLYFKMTDAQGKSILKTKKGLSPYFVFEYQAPNQKLSIRGVFHPKENFETKQGKGEGFIPGIPENFTSEKELQFERLKEFFPDKAMFSFLYKQPVEDITKAVDHYFVYLEKQKAKIGPNAKINFKLFSDILIKKYYKGEPPAAAGKIKPKVKTAQELELEKQEEIRKEISNKLAGDNWEKIKKETGFKKHTEFIVAKGHLCPEGTDEEFLELWKMKKSKVA